MRRSNAWCRAHLQLFILDISHVGSPKVPLNLIYLCVFCVYGLVYCLCTCCVVCATFLLGVVLAAHMFALHVGLVLLRVLSIVMFFLRSSFVLCLSSGNL